jgi:hypothetical protein
MRVEPSFRRALDIDLSTRRSDPGLAANVAPGVWVVGQPVELRGLGSARLDPHSSRLPDALASLVPGRGRGRR